MENIDLDLNKKLKHYKKNRVDPYPYPPPQSKVKVSRHGTGTDKWPFRNSFTSQFPLESISNMLSIYRLPKSSGPPFFCGFFKICSGLFAFHLAFSSVFICNGFYMMERCSYQRQDPYINDSMWNIPFVDRRCRAIFTHH